jgi:hypothetical protein
MSKKILTYESNNDPFDSNNWYTNLEFQNEEDLKDRIYDLCYKSNFNVFKYGPKAIGTIRSLRVYDASSFQDMSHMLDSEEIKTRARENVEEASKVLKMRERESDLVTYNSLKEKLQIKD